MATNVTLDAPRKPQNDTFAVLRIPSFSWFLAGTTLSNAGQWIQQVTLSWLIYDITSSGAMLGTLNLVRSLATIGLAPIAGVAIDRIAQRKLLYAAALWLCAISVGFGVVLLGNPQVVWPLFLFSFLGGIGQAVSMPLRQTVVFSVLPRPLAPTGVALVQTGWAIMRSLGPALGGFLILWFGPAGNFFVQGVAYALVAFTVFKLTLPDDESATSKPKPRGTLREGWDYIASQPTTRAFVFLSWVLPLFIIPNFNALPPIYAKDVFAGGPDTLGLLLSAVGVGGIVGGFVTASLGKQERRGLLQLVALLLLSLSLIGVALTAIFWVAVVCMGLAGFFEMIYLTTNMTLIQLSIPDELRGRVTGIVSLRSGLMPVGAFIAGIGADFVGPRAMTVVLGGIAGLIALVAYLVSSTIRDYRLSDVMESAE
ncbi:MAG TPA: MFS transporter [Caldilineaceae bacterium]|nr:MFS transporter [Caldilineaceae bacterium]